MNITKAIFPLLISLSLVLLLSLHASAAALLGGWTPITNVKDPHVVEIGRYAVLEYNRQSKSVLKFRKVVSGETQVVAGTNYRLVVAVNGGKKYEAVVWEKPWLKSMNLTSFKPTNKGHFL